MIPQTLTPEEAADLRRALRARRRRVRARAYIRGLDGRVRWEVSTRLEPGGQVVQGNPAQGPGRAMSISLLDPAGRYPLDVDPDTGIAIPPMRFLASATYGIWLPTMEKWRDVPVFYGSLVAASREGPRLRLEAHSLERRMMIQPRTTIRIERGQNKISAIRELLRAAGQTRFSLGTSTARMEAALTITPSRDSPTLWAAAAKIARSLGCQLFADARGVVRRRRNPTRPTYTLSPAEVVTEPTYTADALEIRNHVVVLGATKNKKQVRAEARLPSSSGLNEWALARNGAPLRETEWVEDTSIGTTSKAQQVANRRLAALAVETVSVSASILTIPMLERGDILALDGYPNACFLEGSIPLPGGVMEIGSTRRTHYRRTRRR